MAVDTDLLPPIEPKNETSHDSNRSKVLRYRKPVNLPADRILEAAAAQGRPITPAEELPVVRREENPDRLALGGKDTVATQDLALGEKDTTAAEDLATGETTSTTAEKFAAGDTPSAATEDLAIGKTRLAQTKEFAAGRTPSAATEAFAAGDTPSAATEALAAGHIPSTATEAFAAGDTPSAATEALAADHIPSTTTETFAAGDTPSAATEALPSGIVRPEKPNELTARQEQWRRRGKMALTIVADLIDDVILPFMKKKPKEENPILADQIADAAQYNKDQQEATVAHNVEQQAEQDALMPDSLSETARALANQQHEEVRGHLEAPKRELAELQDILTERYESRGNYEAVGGPPPSEPKLTGRVNTFLMVNSGRVLEMLARPEGSVLPLCISAVCAAAEPLAPHLLAGLRPSAESLLDANDLVVGHRRNYDIPDA